MNDDSDFIHNISLKKHVARQNPVFDVPSIEKNVDIFISTIQVLAEGKSSKLTSHVEGALLGGSDGAIFPPEERAAAALRHLLL